MSDHDASRLAGAARECRWGSPRDPRFDRGSWRVGARFGGGRKRRLQGTMTPISLPAIADVPGPALTARLYEIRKAERSLLVEFLVYLAELDRRKLYLELGFSSTFAFLTDHLGLTRSSAFRRT